MKPHEWIYVGDPIPDIHPQENADFILQMQNAMVTSLVKRSLLTTWQAEQIKENMERKAAKRKS